MTLLLHIVPARDWQAAQAAGAYRPASLDTEGFIHCSEPRQVLEVANRLFAGRRDLLLLGIDPERAGVPLRYENLEGGSEQYPHLYGALRPEAVTGTWPLTPDGDTGRFSALPGGLAG